MSHPMTGKKKTALKKQHIFPDGIFRLTHLFECIYTLDHITVLIYPLLKEIFTYSSCSRMKVGSKLIHTVFGAVLIQSLLQILYNGMIRLLQGTETSYRLDRGYDNVKDNKSRSVISQRRISGRKYQQDDTRGKEKSHPQKKC